MTDGLRALLTSKLDDPDPVVRAHAKARLAAADAEPKPAYPSLAAQAANLGSTLVDWAASGFAMAPGEERHRRLEICRSCPLWDPTRGRCTACGCWTETKVKLQTSECPEGKW